MQTKNKLSIITPSYNQGRYLEQAIASVLNQDYENRELIVLDGGSSDGSREVLERNAPRLAFWRSAADGGQTAALNEGVRHVTGDITGWINSDDYYLPGAFAAVAERFAQPDAPDVVFGYSVTVDGEGNLLREDRHDDFDLPSVLASGMDVRQQAMFWRSSLNSKVFPLDETLRFCMDLQLVIRLASAGARFVRIPIHLGAFRVHDDAKTSLLQDVCRREHEALVEAVRTETGVRLPPRPLVVAKRRWHFLMRGEWKYAIYGGSRSITPHVRDLAAGAALWGRRR